MSQSIFFHSYNLAYTLLLLLLAITTSTKIIKATPRNVPITIPAICPAVKPSFVRGIDDPDAVVV